MAEETGQERTEQPTPKRLRDAREKGQVARSRELSTLVVMLASSLGMLMLGRGMISGLVDVFRTALQPQRSQVFDPGAITAMLSQAGVHTLAAMGPFTVLLVVAALVSPLALGGLTFSAEALTFKWEKLDPVKGLGRVFGWRGLMELVKALAKFLIIGIAAAALMWSLAGAILALGGESVRAGLASTAHLLVWAFTGMSLALAAIAVVDVPFQVWNHNRELKMTRQEIKDEFKETEGRPEVKGKIRNLQREMARRRMMSEVPKADVIVTNPTHYAVALRYDPDTHNAPIVVAKGRDFIAQQIRRIGTAYHVAELSAPPLARAIYHSTELDAPIPAGLYLAVAQVLAYVYQLKRAQEHGGERPVPPTDLPIPEDMKRDA